MIEALKFFTSPTLCHSTSETPFAVNHKWLAVRILTVGLTTYAVSRVLLSQRLSLLLPITTGLMTYLWSKAQLKKEIDYRLMGFICSDRPLSEDVQKQISEIDLTNHLTRTEGWNLINRSYAPALFNNPIFKQLVEYVFKSMTLPEKKQAFAQVLSNNNDNFLQILLETNAATPTELEIGEGQVSLTQALLLKHYKFNVQASMLKSNCDFATIGNGDANQQVSLGIICVHLLIDWDVASFEGAYSRMQNAKSFWGAPNEGLFDLTNEEVLKSLWESALRSRYFPSDANNLFGEVAKTYYELLPEKSRVSLFEDMRVNREMVQYLLKHEIIPLSDCNQVIQHICWTYTRIIDATTAKVLTEVGFDPNAKNSHTTCLQTVIMDRKYLHYVHTSMSWLEHIEILLEAGAKYNDDLVDYCTCLSKQSCPESLFLGLLNKYPNNKAQ